MPSPRTLSTPKCPAEQRAWLLVYTKRIGTGQHLTEAFNKQFPYRGHTEIHIHASNARNCDAVVQSQLLELAKQFPWYEEPPKEGERNYARMKHLERRQEARDRIRMKELQTVEGSTGQEDGGEVEMGEGSKSG